MLLRFFCLALFCLLLYVTLVTVPISLSSCWIFLWSFDFWNNRSVPHRKQDKKNSSSSILLLCCTMSCHKRRKMKQARKSQYRWQNYFSLYFWEGNTAESLTIIGRMSDLLKSLLSTQDSLLPVCYIFCTVEVWTKLVGPIIANVWYI